MNDDKLCGAGRRSMQQCILRVVLRSARLENVGRNMQVACASVVSTVIVTALVFALICREGGCPRTVEWDEATWGKVKTKNEYCEYADTGSIVQTIANSFSNAGFICVGTIIIFVGVNDWLYPSVSASSQRVAVVNARLGPAISVLWGLSQIYVGAGSFLYHASRTPLAQRIDVAAIYSTLSAPILYDLVRFMHWEPRPLTAAFFFAILEIVLSVLGVIYKDKMRSVIMLPTLIAVDVVLQLLYYLVWPGRLQTRRRLSSAGWLMLMAALSLGGLAFGIRSVDRGKDCPFPERGVFQAHALFHVVASIALGFGYAASRAEIVVSAGDAAQDVQATDRQCGTKSNGESDVEEHVRKDGVSMLPVEAA